MSSIFFPKGHTVDFTLCLSQCLLCLAVANHFKYNDFCEERSKNLAEAHTAQQNEISLESYIPDVTQSQCSFLHVPKFDFF